MRYGQWKTKTWSNKMLFHRQREKRAKTNQGILPILANGWNKPQFKVPEAQRLCKRHARKSEQANCRHEQRSRKRRQLKVELLSAPSHPLPQYREQDLTASPSFASAPTHETFISSLLFPEVDRIFRPRQLHKENHGITEWFKLERILKII